MNRGSPEEASFPTMERGGISNCSRERGGAVERGEKKKTEKGNLKLTRNLSSWKGETVRLVEHKKGA